MVVPEKGHALGQRRGCAEHFSHPPASQLETFARLFLLEALALHLGCTDTGTLSKDIGVGSPRGRRRERRARRLGKQLFHRLLARQTRVTLDLRLRCCKARAGEQMPRIVVAESRCDRQCNSVRRAHRRQQKRRYQKTHGPPELKAVISRSP